jgi:hypothetical protein
VHAGHALGRDQACLQIVQIERFTEIVVGAERVVLLECLSAVGGAGRGVAQFLDYIEDER